MVSASTAPSLSCILKKFFSFFLFLLLCEKGKTKGGKEKTVTEKRDEFSDPVSEKVEVKVFSEFVASQVHATLGTFIADFM